ncbi:MAG: dihydropteroate synthase [Ignavibacteria bacterium]|nr:dihydropteroate synthase [Ignavibacteria bacterium]
MLSPSRSFRIRDLDLRSRCHIMGIVNVTPDSFSDGGRFPTPQDAIAHAVLLAGEGADILDIGGESTRPGAVPVTTDEEIRRVLPVIEGLWRVTDVPISIDTRKAAVADLALRAGADIVNDVSALCYDAAMAGVAESHDVPVILMHAQGTPETMQDAPVYADVLREVRDFLEERLLFARARGITRLLIDPGIGFGKRHEDNLALLRELHSFLDLGVPLVVGTSRKSFLGRITGRAADERLAGSIASGVVACLHGASILRVHDVRETRDAVLVAETIGRVAAEAH